TPAGTARQVKPRRSVSDERLTARPAESEAHEWKLTLKRRHCDGVFLCVYMYFRCKKLFCSNGLSGYIFLHRYKFWTLVNNGSEVLV
ncbi:hypothetical protein ABEV54_18915, partial [Peribacillus psychrosaccharolyticus]